MHGSLSVIHPNQHRSSHSMTETTPTAIRLADYTPTPYAIDTVELDIYLDPEATLVHSRIAMRPHPQTPEGGLLMLDGEALDFVSAKIDGKDTDCAMTEQGLT